MNSKMRSREKKKKKKVETGRERYSIGESCMNTASRILNQKSLNIPFY